MTAVRSMCHALAAPSCEKVSRSGHLWIRSTAHAYPALPPAPDGCVLYRNHTPSRPPAEGVLRITVTEMTTRIYAELAKCGYPVARPSPRAPRQLPPVPVATPSATSPPVNHDPIRPGRDMDTPATRAGRRGASLGNDGARRQVHVSRIVQSPSRNVSLNVQYSYHPGELISGISPLRRVV